MSRYLLIGHSKSPSQPMPGLTYLFVFECKSCGTEATVTRTEARNLYPNPDALTAVDEVLQQEKGWTKAPSGVYCPGCTEARD